MEQMLKLGEWAIVGHGWLKKRRIMFAGESSPDVYSLATEWTEGYNSSACNLYFHKSQHEFPVFDGRITILDVTKQELRFRFDK
jgi:hypothetical protein